MTLRVGLPGKAQTRGASCRRVPFRELSIQKRVGIVLLGTLQFGLLIAAERDIQRRPPDQINGAKGKWRLLCLINFVGPLSYFRWGRKAQ